MSKNEELETGSSAAVLVASATEEWKSRVDSVERTVSRVKGAVVLAGSAVAFLVSFSGWWKDLLSEDAVTLAIPTSVLWPLLLIGSVAVTYAIMQTASFRWRRYWEKSWADLWTAKLSLLPEWRPSGYVTKSGVVVVSLRVINRGPHKWFVETIDEVAGGVSVNNQSYRLTREAVDSLTIPPWADWNLRFRAKLPEVEEATAVRVEAGALTLWVRGDAKKEATAVRVEGCTLWLPLRTLE